MQNVFDKSCYGFSNDVAVAGIDSFDKKKENLKKQILLMKLDTFIV